jgi:ribosome-associated toxin RatA of RatAB toxin-antitoxin module
MSEVHEQTVVAAPISTVWALVGDPSRYPEWLPRVFEVQGQRFEEGAEFIQVSQQPLIGRDEAHFLVDRRDELREIRMHCTISGMFAHWQLTEARGDTFVHAVFGMEPLRRRDRLIDFTLGRRFFSRWLAEAIDSLKATAQVSAPSSASSAR